MRFVLLVGEEGRLQQSAHESGEAVTGELALAPPLLGASQRLLNRSHRDVYYRVSPQPAALLCSWRTQHLLCCTKHQPGL